MRNKKAIFAGALMVPALALTGGVAYATTTGGPATPARTTVTTVQPTSHNPAGQITHYRCNWQQGDHRCDARGYGYQRPANQRQATHRPATHRQVTQQRGYMGNWGYRGGYGYQGGYSGNHCGDGCGW